jgi:hypothetical protein
MAEDQAAGCTRPTASSVVEEPSQPDDIEQPTVVKKERTMIHVGEKAPDFVAPGYQNGKFLDGVKLSDYAGKWLLLCFYPGDFTFV